MKIRLEIGYLLICLFIYTHSPTHPPTQTQAHTYTHTFTHLSRATLSQALKAKYVVGEVRLRERLRLSGVPPSTSSGSPLKSTTCHEDDEDEVLLMTKFCSSKSLLFVVIRSSYPETGGTD